MNVSFFGRRSRGAHDSAGAKSDAQVTTHEESTTGSRSSPALGVLAKCTLCPLCSEFVPTGVSATGHATTLAHLLAKQAPKQSLWLTESNRGYQLLQRMGWREDHGLGAAQQGRMEPVASVLKEDRRGLGRPSSKAPSAAAGHSGIHAADGSARVTHFPSHSEAEAAAASDGLSRAEREQLLRSGKGGPSLHAIAAAALQARASNLTSAGAAPSVSARDAAAVTRVAAHIAAAAAAQPSSAWSPSSSQPMSARGIVRQAIRTVQADTSQRREARVRRLAAEIMRDDDLPDDLLSLYAGASHAKRPKR